MTDRQARVLGVPVKVAAETTPGGRMDLYLVALKDESNRRQLADRELSREVADQRSDFSELRAEVKADMSEVKADVAVIKGDLSKITLGMKGGKVFLGVLVTLAASFGPEIVKIIKHLIGFSP
jgi:DNA-binding transcriptional regulator GbsR (MarR family)